MIVAAMADREHGIFEHRIDAAIGWCSSHIATGRDGQAGWGWVPDVPPNPQNTAEVVCALRSAGREIPRHDEVLALVRCDAVMHASHGDWAFRAPIDVAWRLRALRGMLDDVAHDPDVLVCARALIEAQDPETGGWRLAGRSGPISITATSSAVLALFGLRSSIDVAPAVRRGVGMLVSTAISGDERANQLHTAAQIAVVLARPEIAQVGGPRSDRARQRTLEHVMTHLTRHDLEIEEEVFQRDHVTDTWRHMTLHMSLLAVCRAAPERIFDPGFRSGLIELLALQEQRPLDVNCGGFRTSREGFVTSYATTLALEVLAQTQHAVENRVSPARMLDLLCRVDGAHHADPQDVVRLDDTTVVMNSSAGAVLMAIGLLSGVTIASLAVGLHRQLGVGGSRTLVVWGTVLAGIGTFSFLATRFPAYPNGRIAAGVFSAFTAVLLPVIAFLLS